MRKAKLAPRALWIEKSSASCEANGPLVSASGKAQKVSDYKTTSALHKAQLRFSCEAKGKALISAISEAAVASLQPPKLLPAKLDLKYTQVLPTKLLCLKEKKYIIVLKH